MDKQNLQNSGTLEGQVTEQPVVTEVQNNDWEFKIDENGDLIFNDNYGKPVETQTPSVPQGQEGQTEQPVDDGAGNQMFEVTVSGQKYEVTLNELMNGYMRQSDYTRKTQELAEIRKQGIQPPQMQQPSVPQPEVKQPTQLDYYNQLLSLAKTRVEKNLGRPYDTLNELDQVALAEEVADIKAQIVQEQAKQYSIQNVITQFQADPDFQEIDRVALQVLDELPYREAMQIRQRLNSGDAQFIAQYLSAVAQEVKKAKGANAQPANPQGLPFKIVPKVPVVEKAGQGISTNPQNVNQMDYGSLGHMNADEQADFIEQYFKRQ